MKTKDIDRLISILEQYENKEVLLYFVYINSHIMATRGICSLDYERKIIAVFDPKIGLKHHVLLSAIGETKPIKMSDGTTCLAIYVHIKLAS